MQFVVALLLALTPQAWAFATQHHVTQNIHGSVAGSLDSDDFLKGEAEEEAQRLANQMDKETDPKESLLQKPAWLDYIPSWLQPPDKKADKKAEAEEDEAEDDTKKAPVYNTADGPSPAPAPEAASGPSAAKKEKKEKPAAKKEKPAAKKEKPAAKKGPVQGADAKRRIETVAHLKEPGEGYQPGSPLYKHQERLADQKEKKGAAPAKSSAVQHLPLLCLWAAAATFFAQL